MLSAPAQGKHDRSARRRRGVGVHARGNGAVKAGVDPVKVDHHGAMHAREVNRRMSGTRTVHGSGGWWVGSSRTRATPFAVAHHSLLSPSTLFFFTSTLKIVEFRQCLFG